MMLHSIESRLDRIDMRLDAIESAIRENAPDSKEHDSIRVNQ